MCLKIIDTCPKGLYINLIHQLACNDITALTIIHDILKMKKGWYHVNHTHMIILCKCVTHYWCNCTSLTLLHLCLEAVSFSTSLHSYFGSNLKMNLTYINIYSRYCVNIITMMIYWQSEVVTAYFKPVLQPGVSRHLILNNFSDFHWLNGSIFYKYYNNTWL